MELKAFSTLSSLCEASRVVRLALRETQMALLSFYCTINHQRFSYISRLHEGVLQADGSCWMCFSKALSRHSSSAHSPPLLGYTLDHTETSALVVMATCDFYGGLRLSLSSAEADTSQPKR